MAATSSIETATQPLDLRFTASELESEHDRILSFIEDHVVREIERRGYTQNLDTAVIGLSGGIDSTLIAYLAVEAVGSENVYGLVMPSEANSDETMNDAERTATELGIDYDIIEIESLTDAITNAVPHQDGTDDAESNLQDMVAPVQRSLTSVRIRTLLEQLSTMTTDGIVVGASNRSEWLTGHFDKHGDGAVDCQPILHLYKQQVRQMADHVGVPARIIDRKASGEVEVAGTDEEVLGVDYDTLDSILALAVDGPVSSARTADHLAVDEEVVEQVISRYEHSSFQRSFAPSLLATKN